MMSTVVWALVVWFAAGAVLAPLSYGMTYAYFQRRWPTLAERDVDRDHGTAVLQAAATFLAPPTLVLTWVMCRRAKHGLLFRA